jgi:MarR family transcriptional regulator, negative regulator of the multidrug operon emrRAB
MSGAKNSKSQSGYLIERLSALHRSLLRKFAAEEGLQFVHIEILQYLSICNHYSDTTQAISEFLGQTKGSLSQSLSHLESHSYLKRSQDKRDKRIFHLILLAKGLAVCERLSESVQAPETPMQDPGFELMLRRLQIKNKLQGFGICSTCIHNQNPGKNLFVCGLTGEKLTVADTEKICREHQGA